MAIHYENYKRFSKGQGFIGSLCRPLSAQARSERWKAVDCPDCRKAIIGKRVISREREIGTARGFDRAGALIQTNVATGGTFVVSLDDFDRNWAPLDIDAIFGDKA